ncbi:hypothetical protein B4083_2192 [Bacillus cereus]|nr:hypothetical protein B4083_2192 [Bacillus cereus]
MLRRKKKVKNRQRFFFLYYTLHPYNPTLLVPKNEMEELK